MSILNGNFGLVALFLPLSCSLIFSFFFLPYSYFAISRVFLLYWNLSYEMCCRYNCVYVSTYHTSLSILLPYTRCQLEYNVRVLRRSKMKNELAHWNNVERRKKEKKKAKSEYNTRKKAQLLDSAHVYIEKTKKETEWNWKIKYFALAVCINSFFFLLIA